MKPAVISRWCYDWNDEPVPKAVPSGPPDDGLLPDVGDLNSVSTQQEQLHQRRQSMRERKKKAEP